MTASSNLKKHAGWWLLGLAAFTYAAGIYLTSKFLCESIGPNVLMLGVVTGGISCATLLVAAITRKSVGTGMAALALALLVLVLAFASFGLTLPGCSGI